VLFGRRLLVGLVVAGGGGAPFGVGGCGLFGRRLRGGLVVAGEDSGQLDVSPRRGDEGGLAEAEMSRSSRPSRKPNAGDVVAAAPLEGRIVGLS
jgi:hypothetical protein